MRFRYTTEEGGTWIDKEIPGLDEVHLVAYLMVALGREGPDLTARYWSELPTGEKCHSVEMPSGLIWDPHFTAPNYADLDGQRPQAKWSYRPPGG